MRVPLTHKHLCRQTAVTHGDGAQPAPPGPPPLTPTALTHTVQPPANPGSCPQFACALLSAPMSLPVPNVSTISSSPKQLCGELRAVRRAQPAPAGSRQFRQPHPRARHSPALRGSGLRNGPFLTTTSNNNNNNYNRLF